MELCTNCSGNGTVNIAGGIKVCCECGGSGEVRGDSEEIKRLRAELAVFKDGMLSKDDMQSLVLAAMSSAEAFQRQYGINPCSQGLNRGIDWLRRIAEKVGGG